MSLNQETVSEALKAVIDPNTGKDLVSSRCIRNLVVDGGDVRFEVELGYPARSQHEPVRRLLADALAKLPGIGQVDITVTSKVVAHAVPHGVKLLPGVRNIVAVASGKGGVGKSTTAVNLALALAAEGARVGILDADIYGPSQPQMLGIGDRRPESVDGKTMEPLEAYGVQAMSIGFLIDPDTPMVWRGPMATQALNQLLKDTAWKDLDYLIIDMPPGTGDIALTLSQLLPLTGAVVVCRPQELALLDAVKAIAMFRKVQIPVLGIVENMTGDIFGRGGAKAKAAELGLPFLGEIPIEAAIRIKGDAGEIAKLYADDSPARPHLIHMCQQAALQIAKSLLDAPKMPTQEIL